MTQNFIIQLGGHFFSIPESETLKIKEVIPMPTDIIPTLSAKKHLKGIFQLRGKIVTLFSLSTILDLPSGKPAQKPYLVLKKDNDLLCFRVDKIIGMKSDLVETKLIQVKHSESRILKRAFFYEDKMVLVLDMEQILNT